MVTERAEMDVVLEQNCECMLFIAHTRQLLLIFLSNEYLKLKS